MAAKKKMSRMERDSLVEQMDRDLEEFILQKIEANKDKHHFNYQATHFT